MDSTQVDNDIHKILLNTKFKVNTSKDYILKLSVALNSFSILLLPFFCTLLATIGHCFSRSRHKKYFLPKHRYLFLKSFKQKRNSKLSFIGPKLILMCTFLLCHDADKNINTDLAKLEKLNKIDFFINRISNFYKSA